MVARLYQQRTQLRKRVDAAPREARPVPRRPNVRWSMDFVGDALGDGRTFRVLNVVDDFSREAVATEVGRSIPGSLAVRVLERTARARGLPETLVVDDGPESTSRVLDRWAYDHQVEQHFIRPGKPVQEAFGAIGAWRIEYNRFCLHSSLGDLMPEDSGERAAA